MRVFAHKTLSNDQDNAVLLYIKYVRLSCGKPFITVVKIRFENSTYFRHFKHQYFYCYYMLSEFLYKEILHIIFFVTLLYKQMCNALWVECVLQ